GRAPPSAACSRRRGDTRALAPACAGHPGAAADLAGAGPDSPGAQVSGWLGAAAHPGDGPADRRGAAGVVQPPGAGLAAAGMDGPDQLPAVPVALATDGLWQPASRRAG